MKKIPQKYWLPLSLTALAISTVGFWCYLKSQFCVDITTNVCNNFLNFTPSTVEIAVGIGIALIIHDHTRRSQIKENTDVELTIQGTYYHLWSLNEALRSYKKSKDVRAENSTSLQILHIINQIHTNLSKCGRNIDSKIIGNLQLSLILIHKAVSISIDPRIETEEYWEKNIESVENAIKNITSITKTNFEKLIHDDYKMTWNN